MSSFEAVVGIHCVRNDGQMKKTYELLALQLDPKRPDREGRSRVDGGVEKDGGSEAGRRN